MKGALGEDRLEDSPMRNSAVGYKPTVPFRKTYGSRMSWEASRTVLREPVGEIPMGYSPSMINSLVSVHIDEPRGRSLYD